MAELFKDNYNKKSVENFADVIKSEHKKFDKKKFVKIVIDKDWVKRELKERMRHISISLFQTFNLPYIDCLDILIKVAPQFKMWDSIILPDFVEVYGQDDYEESVDALEYFTQFSSSEFAVRPFIIKYTDKMMKRMLKWSKHKNHHVRRLASEGCRPRLPWAISLPNFKKDPSLILPILENLKNDESEYVRKSVANNLNDISKDNPDITLDITSKWIGDNKNTDWICKHACRTLLKKGNEQALELFSISNKIKYSLNNFKIEKPKIKIGDDNYFSFDLELKEKEAKIIRLEYTVHYMKSNGKHSKKVFKISEVEYTAGEKKSIRRKQPFRDFTTRKHYPGKHKISVIVNGIESEPKEFELV